MNQNKEPDLSTAPIPFRNHTALLLGVALPYLQPAYRHPIELALKFLEFTETLRLYREFHTGVGGYSFSTTAYSFGRPDNSVQNPPDNSGFLGVLNNYITDPEALLVSLSSVCIGDEKELIGMFLNLIRAKNFYDTYGELLKSQVADSDGLAGLFSGLGGFAGFGNPFNGTPSPQQSNPEPSAVPAPTPFAPDLSGMLNAEQKETLDLLKSLFSED